MLYQLSHITVSSSHQPVMLFFFNLKLLLIKKEEAENEQNRKTTNKHKQTKKKERKKKESNNHRKNNQITMFDLCVQKTHLSEYVHWGTRCTASGRLHCKRERARLTHRKPMSFTDRSKSLYPSRHGQGKINYF